MNNKKVESSRTEVNEKRKSYDVMTTGIGKILTVAFALTLATDFATAAATFDASATTTATLPSKESTVAMSSPAASASTTEPKTTETETGTETPKPMSDVVSKSIVDQIMTSINKNAAGNVTKSQNVLPPEVFAGAMQADQPQGDITKTLQRRSQMAEGKPLVSSILNESWLSAVSLGSFEMNASKQYA